MKKFHGYVFNAMSNNPSLTSVDNKADLAECTNEYYFDGLCMLPGKSWNAQMELEHWNRYMIFSYLAESATVLDMACGEGYGTHYLSTMANKAVGIDISVANIQHAVSKYCPGKTNLDYIVSDACSISFNEKIFDVIVSFETIEHVEDIAGFLSGIYNVMLDDGVGIISTPRPNINLVTGRPYNPHHVRELYSEEFRSFLNNYYEYVELAGQSKEFPCEIHRGYDNESDAYAIAIVSNKKNIVDRIIKRLPCRKILSIREKLFERHTNRIKNFKKSLRVLFVPLKSVDCDNPADRRRILIPAEYLREYGAEVAVVNKEDAIKIKSNIILSQNRDYKFWLDNIDLLAKSGSNFIFSFSDALGLTTKSKTHYYEAFTGQNERMDYSVTNNLLKLFLEKCCSHVLAGSEVQKQIISEFAPGISVSISNDPIDAEIYNKDMVAGLSIRRSDVLTLIWEGYCDNLPYLLACTDAIKNIAKKIPVRVIVTTSLNRRNEFMGTANNEELAKKILGDVVEFHVWARQTISQLMAVSDIALAPLFNNCDFARAKPANKAIIYNYMKLPVIASPVPSYESYIQNNVNGFIAYNQTDWEKYIEYLFVNHEQRLKMAEMSHQKADENYNIKMIGNQMLRLFLALT